MQATISTNAENFQKMLSFLSIQREKIKQKFGELYENFLSNIESLDLKSKKITETNTVNILQNYDPVIILILNQFLMLNRLVTLFQIFQKNIHHMSQMILQVNISYKNIFIHDDQSRIISRALINKEVRNHLEFSDDFMKKNLNTRSDFNKPSPEPIYLHKGTNTHRSMNDFSRYQVVHQHSISLAGVSANIEQASARPHDGILIFSPRCAGSVIKVNTKSAGDKEASSKLNLSEPERNINEIDPYNETKNSFKSHSPSKVQGSPDSKNILNKLASSEKPISLKKSKEKNAADENSILKSKNDLKDPFKFKKKIKKSENLRSKSLEFLESKAISLKLSKVKTIKNHFKTLPSIKYSDLSLIPLSKPPHHDSYAKNNYLEEKGFRIKPKTKLKKKSIKENKMLIEPITIFTPKTLQENVKIESFDISKKSPISDYHLSKFPKPSSNLLNQCYEFDKDALMSMFSKLNHIKEIDMKKINFSKIVKNLSQILDSPIKGLWNINIIQMKKIIESKASNKLNKIVLKYIEKVLIEMYLHEFYSSLKELIIFSRYLDSIVVYFSFIYIDYCSEKSSVKKNLIRKLISFLQGGENKAPNLMKSKNFSVYNYFKEILFNVFL